VTQDLTKGVHPPSLELATPPLYGTLSYFDRYWMFLGPLIASLFIMRSVTKDIVQNDTLLMLSWLALPSYTIHQFEEVSLDERRQRSEPQKCDERSESQKVSRQIGVLFGNSLRSPPLAA